MLSIIGAMIGGLVGTFAIPMPLVGTLIGIVGGALIFESLRVPASPGSQLRHIRRHRLRA